MQPQTRLIPSDLRDACEGHGQVAGGKIRLRCSKGDRRQRLGVFSRLVEPFFLPNILLSGFVFPFLGMPKWAQAIGEALPLTRFLRIVRSIMLKGSTLADLRYDTLALTVLTAIAMTIAVTRFRRTLD